MQKRQKGFVPDKYQFCMATHAPVFPAQLSPEIKRFITIKEKCIKLNNTEICGQVIILSLRTDW